MEEQKYMGLYLPCPRQGSNPGLGKQWSRDYPIDVPATPTLPDANLPTTKKLSTGANEEKENVVTFRVYCPFAPVKSFFVAKLQAAC